MEGGFGGGGGGEVEAIEDSLLGDAEAAIDEARDDGGKFLVVLVVGQDEVEAGVAALGAGVQVDEGFDEVAGEGGGEAAGVGGEDIAADGLMDLGGGAGAAAAGEFGGEGLAEDGLADLAIEVLAEAFVEFGAAGLAGLGKLDEHRVGDDGGGVGADIGDGAEEGLLIGLGGAGAVLAEAERLAEDFGEGDPVFQYIVLEQIGPSGGAGDAAANRQSGFGLGEVDDELERVERGGERLEVGLLAAGVISQSE